MWGREQAHSNCSRLALPCPALPCLCCHYAPLHCISPFSALICPPYYLPWLRLQVPQVEVQAQQAERVEAWQGVERPADSQSHLEAICANLAEVPAAGGGLLADVEGLQDKVRHRRALPGRTPSAGQQRGAGSHCSNML